MNQVEINDILAKLPEGDRRKMKGYLSDFDRSARKAAIAGILARNFSHSIGINVNLNPEGGDIK